MPPSPNDPPAWMLRLDLADVRRFWEAKLGIEACVSRSPEQLASVLAQHGLRDMAHWRAVEAQVWRQRGEALRSPTSRQFAADVAREILMRPATGWDPARDEAPLSSRVFGSGAPPRTESGTRAKDGSVALPGKRAGGDRG